MTTPTILSLDASSTQIGYCLYNGRVLASGEIAIAGDDIAERCLRAQQALENLLSLYEYAAIDCLAIEAPVARFAKAVIPQARVSGALMACASAAGLLVVEVSVPHVKQALCGRGNAPKLEMQTVARALHGVVGEHAADALGVVLWAARVVRVEREAA